MLLNVGHLFIDPIPSMSGIFNYIWLIFMVDVGKYTIHGCYGDGFVFFDIDIHDRIFCISFGPF